MRFVWLMVCFSLLACGDDDATPVPEPGREGRAPAVDDDPLAGLDDPEAITDTPEVSAVPAGAPMEVPPLACVTFGDVRVWPREGVPSVVAMGDTFAFAGYAASEGDTEEIFVVTAAPGQPTRPVLREALERPFRTPRGAPPGLAALDAGHLGLAITDLGARVLFDALELDGDRLGFRQLGSGADQRFAPAVLAAGDTRVVVYTDASDESATHARAVRIDPTGTVVARHDLTPVGASGRAPTAALSGPPAVVFVDAREATSTALLVRFDGLGVPGEATVLRPLANLYDPAEIAAGPVGDHWLIGFTAIGSGAATAVGVAIASGASIAPPTPMVPSEGYGTLGVSGASDGSQVVFACDAPQGEERTAPREIRVRVARVGILGEPLVIQGPDGTARHAAIARRSDGTYAVAFASAGAVHARFLRCDERRP